MYISVRKHEASSCLAPSSVLWVLHLYLIAPVYVVHAQLYLPVGKLGVSQTCRVGEACAPVSHSWRRHCTAETKILNGYATFMLLCAT